MIFAERNHKSLQFAHNMKTIKHYVAASRGKSIISNLEHFIAHIATLHYNCITAPILYSVDKQSKRGGYNYL